MPAQRHLPARRSSAFTLLELMVVLTIVLALLGIGFPVWRRQQANANLGATRTLVHAVAAAIANYPVRTLTLLVDEDGDDADADGRKDANHHLPATPRVKRVANLWDCNADVGGAIAGDGVIDGRPAAAASASDDGPFPAAVLAAGYTGFARMTQLALQARNLDARERVIDAWKTPLRIAWSATAYGPAGFGVWSAGSDRVDGTNDDIASWKE